MNMPVETIRHIENRALTISADLNDNTTDNPVMILPDDMVIHDIEEHMELRNQFRAEMETQSIDDFVNYFKEYKGESCFINAEDMRAKTIFDIGTIEEPKHCKHKALLQLNKTSSFKELLRINALKHDQKEMADWIEEWHDIITPLTDDSDQNDIPLSTAIAAIRRLTIEEIKKSDHEQGSFRTAKTSMESIEAKADEGMPGYFKFTCTPYEGLKEQQFILRLNILKSHNMPMFVMRVQRIETIIENLAKEFQELLASKLPDSCKTYIGDLTV